MSFSRVNLKIIQGKINNSGAPPLGLDQVQGQRTKYFSETSVWVERYIIISKFSQRDSLVFFDVLGKPSSCPRIFENNEFPFNSVSYIKKSDVFQEIGLLGFFIRFNYIQGFKQLADVQISLMSTVELCK